MKKLLVFVLLLLSTHLAGAREIHVAIGAGSQNDGSRAKPFRSIFAAAQVAQLGDTIDKIAETKDVLAQTTVGGIAVSTQPGEKDYSVEPVKTVYAFTGGGKKTVRFDADGIPVNVEAQGNFTEQLPLLKYSGDSFTQSPGRLTLRHGGTIFVVTGVPQTQIEIQPAEAFIFGLERVIVTLKSQNSLNYHLAFVPAP